ncbi:MAG: hypothetical protein CMJ67_09025 [Planctomycetaceae bacterium]|nr:hypothetical protein [Planctomycetaceae bacterium]
MINFSTQISALRSAIATIAVGAVTMASAGETGSQRVLLRLAADTVVHVDARGGRWLLPEPTRRSLRFEDMVFARMLHDDLLDAGLESMESVFPFEPAHPEIASEIGLDRWVVATFDSVEGAARAVRSVSELSTLGGPIEMAELDGRGGVASSVPSDTWIDFQYGIRNTGQNIAGVNGVAGADVNVIPAWDWSIGSSDVVIAVLDAGVDFHEEFDSRLTAGWNVPDGNDSFFDECSSHGTHVTGIMAAEGNNDQGIAGVSWRCRIMPVVVVDGCTGFESWVAEGIIWAVDHGADIINMSLQYSAGNQILADAVAYADAAGVIQVAAAGNTGGSDDVQAPARFPETIAVAAIDNRDEHWPSSSAGPEIDIAAPGWRVYSCSSNFNYVYKNGTSMAAPFVSGALGLMKSLEPDLDPVTARVVLRSTAVDILAAGPDNLSGSGRLDIQAAVLALDPDPPAAGDLDRDGRVDGQDFGLMLVQWGPCPGDCEDVCGADLNGDCIVNGQDLGLLLLDWTG